MGKKSAGLKEQSVVALCVGGTDDCFKHPHVVVNKNRYDRLAGLPVGGQQGRSWRAGNQSSSSGAAAPNGHRGTPHRRHGDDGAKNNDLDVPLSWSGKNPDKWLQ
eukprot:5870622-Amphidinium_carterae.3